MDIMNVQIGLRSILASLCLLACVIFCTVGGFLLGSAEGFIALGLTSGYAAYLLGASGEDE